MPVVQQETIALPEPRRKSRVSVEEALAARRSRRAYSTTPLTLAEVGQLLWAAQGITGPENQRTAPSAGALYPLEVYLSAVRVKGLAPGIYHYDPADHTITLHNAGDKRREVTEAANDQDVVRYSACAILFAAVFPRMTPKYGERGRMLVEIEAGHASQNAQLQAAALGVSACPVGAFSFEKARAAFLLPRDEDPVYLLTAGKPA